MYEKLGDLLNEALEKGEIKHQENSQLHSQSQSEQEQKSDFDLEFEVLDSLDDLDGWGQSPNVRGLSPTVQSIQNVQSRLVTPPVGRVIKKEVLVAFNLFQLPTTASITQVRQRYHYLLKKTHPDTQSQNNNAIDISIDDLKKAYEILEKFLLS